MEEEEAAGGTSGGKPVARRTVVAGAVVERMVGPNPPELQEALRRFSRRVGPPREEPALTGVVGILPSGNPGEGLSHPSVRDWNWGAFLAGPVWALFHGMPVLAGILLLVCWLWPLPNLLLGFYGGQMAWRMQPYRDVAEFEEAQRRWALWGLGLFLAGLLGAAGILLAW